MTINSRCNAGRIQTALWAALLYFFASYAIGQQVSDPLTAQVNQIIEAHKGKVALYAENLATHQVLTINADVPVKTASVIKLGILYEALEEIREGKARWDEPIALKKDDEVSGSGILQFLDAPLTLTLRDVVTLMIDLSDNTATNLLIDRFGTASVDARMQSIGLTNTYLYKKISKPATEPMPADQPKFGLGKTTAREMAMLIARFGNCQLSNAAPTAADPALCSTAIEMLQHQFYRDAIPRYLEMLDSSELGTAIANKTGALNAVRNDVALIGTKRGLLVLSVFTYDNTDQSWQSDNAAELTIARLAKVIVQAWAPDGLNPETLKPVPTAH
ncbi:MAG: serine hydrolase [Terracidiphilus sp.]|jgi:beta-lactamase class A